MKPWWGMGGEDRAVREIAPNDLAANGLTGYIARHPEMAIRKQFFVYMMTNFRHGSIYAGVTSNLPVRVWQHRNHAFKGSFTDRYDLTVLVWYEAHASAEAAIEREKQLKDWHRSWKVELIEAANPRWNDLWDEIVQ